MARHNDVKSFLMEKQQKEDKVISRLDQISQSLNRTAPTNCNYKESTVHYFVTYCTLALMMVVLLRLFGIL